MAVGRVSLVFFFRLRLPFFASATKNIFRLPRGERRGGDRREKVWRDMAKRRKRDGQMMFALSRLLLVAHYAAGVGVFLRGKMRGIC